MFTYLLTIVSIILSNKYFVSSNTDKDYLNKITLKMFRKKIILVRNWVEYKDKINIENRKNSILTVGRLEKQKNIRLLIELTKKNNFSLDIVGSGTLENELKNSTKGYKHINFLETLLILNY